LEDTPIAMKPLQNRTYETEEEELGGVADALVDPTAFLGAMVDACGGQGQIPDSLAPVDDTTGLETLGRDRLLLAKALKALKQLVKRRRKKLRKQQRAEMISAVAGGRTGAREAEDDDPNVDEDDREEVGKAEEELGGEADALVDPTALLGAMVDALQVDDVGSFRDRLRELLGCAKDFQAKDVMLHLIQMLGGIEELATRAKRFYSTFLRDGSLPL